MKVRIIVGTALTVMLLALLYFGGYVYLAVWTLFSIAATYEVALALQKKDFRPICLPACVFAACMPWVYFFFGVSMLAALYLVVILVTAGASFILKGRTAGDGVMSLFLLVYPLALMATMGLVYFEFGRANGLTAACFALVAPEVSDTLAYFGGTLLGKRKLCPRISPKKTVAGSLCATLGGLLFGVAMIFIQRSWGGSVPAAVLPVLGLACGVLSQLGDLFASTIKRWADIKDFSSIFPGHGGIMDRIDSILFCAPMTLVVFLVLQRMGAI